VLIVDRQQVAHLSRMARKSDKLHERFRKALEEGPLHSPLGRWMAQRRRQLEALFRDGEPDWAKMAEAFGRAAGRERSDAARGAAALNRCGDSVPALRPVVVDVAVLQDRAFVAAER
jgi:hypothetical protein